MSRVSGLAFGIYLIHDHPNVRARFFTGRFAALASRPVLDIGNGLLTALLGYVLATVIICLVLEGLRVVLFRALHIPKLLQSGEARLIAYWEKKNNDWQRTAGNM